MILDTETARSVYAILLAANNANADVYLDMPHVELSAMPGGVVELTPHDGEPEEYEDDQAFAVAYHVLHNTPSGHAVGCEELPPGAKRNCTCGAGG